jgi:hypothetical protein
MENSSYSADKVHNDIDTVCVAQIRYGLPNPVVIEDSNYAVQYLYYNTKGLRTTHEIIALMTNERFKMSCWVDTVR